MLEYIILGIIYQNTLTGYEIRKTIEFGIGMFYKASYGSIYPLLQRLLANKLVTCREVDGANRRQKEYTITESGKKYFMDWMDEEEPQEQKIEAFMAKVFFMDLFGEQLAFQHIGMFQLRVERYLSKLYKKREAYIALPNQEMFYYKLSTLYFGIAKLQSLLEWCKVVKDRTPLEELVH